MINPLDTQIGGSHYKAMKIQPMEYSMANKLDACQHTAIKYITRFRDKGGVQDLEKAKHCIDMLIEFERRSKEAKAPADALPPSFVPYSPNEPAPRPGIIVDTYDRFGQVTYGREMGDFSWADVVGYKIV